MSLDEITTKHLKTADFHPPYKQELGSLENADGAIKDNLFWVQSCRFEGRDYEATGL